MLQDAMAEGCQGFGRESGELRVRIQDRLCLAMWTLRRLPDPEMAWLYGADRAKWPEVRKDYHGESNPAAPKGFKLQLSNRREKDYATQVLLKARPTASEITDMQPALDMLQLLPDVIDRKLVSAVAWHFDGELGTKIYWDEVRPWLHGRLASAHARTLKRHYDRSIDWLAALVVINQ